ncbi:MAG: TraR/DksA family transcriptional regulator [Gammaproteobacteria bacterium]|nr:TraR/DksA family transcriptional regulator [Gammaproteobacteria bacterium]
MNFKKQLEELRRQYTQRRDAIHIDVWHEEQPVEKDFAEQVVQSENDDVLAALDNDAKQTVMRIDNALLRLEAGHFGYCLACGKKIPDGRLQLVPYAEHCVECAELNEH